ncbi:MAG: NAD(P)H-hydrate dehydratase [Planctomycetota bacterium]
MAGLEIVTEIPKLPVRPRDGHKGTFGRVFVVGGSRGMAGAPCLAAMAALRSGAGLVQVGVPAGMVSIVSAKLLEATVVPLAGQATLEMNAQATILEVAREAQVVIYGPGLGPGPGMTARFSGVKGAIHVPDPVDDGTTHGETGGRHAAEPKVSMGALERIGGSSSSRSLGSLGSGGGGEEEIDGDVPTSATDSAGEPQTVALPQQAVGLNRLSAAVVQRVRTALILDADGLNAIASRPMLLASRRGRTTIITPHPGEMARLTGLEPARIAQEREKIAAEWALKLQSIVVLKGAGTVVTDGRRLYVNTTGNPGMGTGGTGDVLSGVIGALVGQGLSGFDAAVLGVHAHGLAGDLAAAALSEPGMIAGDLIQYLPQAWRRLAER